MTHQLIERTVREWVGANPKRGARTACMALSVAGPFNRTRDAGLIRPRPRKRRPQT